MTKTNPLLLIAFLGLSLLNISHAAAGMDAEPEIKSANAEFVYKYLLGEIAGQRGDLSLSSQLFLNLAKKTQDPRIAERATRTAAYARQQNLALEAATLWADLAPESPEAQRASSQMLIATGNVQSAIPHMKKLLANEAMRGNGFLHLNDLLSNQEDKQETLAIVQDLAAPYPQSAEAQLAVAQSAWKANDLGTAKAAAIKASELRPGWEVSTKLHGQILSKGSPNEAASLYKTFLNQYPKAHKVRLSYAKLLVRLKRHKEAKPEFIKLADNSNGNPETSAIVGLLSLEANEFNMAEKYLKQALDNGFNDREQLYIYLGRTAEQKNNIQTALKWYKRVPTENRHYLAAQFAIADVIQRQKGLDAAIKMLNNVKGLSTEQRLVVAQMQAGMLAQEGRHEDTYKLLQKTVNSIPNTPQLIYDYAMAAERIGKLDEMEKELRKVIQLQPDYAAAYNALGYSFADRNINLNEAKTLIETAVKLSPGDHYILDSLGWVEYRLGNYPTAIEHLRKAHSIQADPEISAHLGEVLWQQGLRDEAKHIWDSALKDHPKNNVLVSTSKKFKP